MLETEALIAGLDIETTGLDQAAGHRIIEVAVIIYGATSHTERARYSTRLNPERGIDPKAQAVHGITYEELVGKPTWPAIAPKLSLLLSKCHYVVAHNGLGFDLPFVWGEFLRAGVSLPEIRLTDTMLQGRWATPDGAIPNLAALCFACGVDYDKSKAHAATYDVEVMMACFFKQLPRGFFSLGSEPFRYTLPKEKT